MGAAVVMQGARMPDVYGEVIVILREANALRLAVAALYIVQDIQARSQGGARITAK